MSVHALSSDENDWAFNDAQTILEGGYACHPKNRQR